MQEIWKDVKGFENCYQISNKGNVKSKELTVVMSWLKSAPTRIKKSKVLVKSIKDNGYEVITFYVKRHYQKYVHRLVAEAFIGNIPKGFTVNHIDGNKANNVVENLEIITYRQNTNHYQNTKNKSSKYAGVYFNKARRKYVAMIRQPKGKKIYLGGFDNEEDANLAYVSKLKEFELEII